MASFSTDGKTFAPVGVAFKAREGKWIGAKVGLFFVRNGKFNDAGSADVDWFRINKKSKVPFPGKTDFEIARRRLRRISSGVDDAERAAHHELFQRFPLVFAQLFGFAHFRQRILLNRYERQHNSLADFD